MFNVGSQELLIIFFVVLLLFGAKRVPEVARSFGEGIRDLKKAMSGIEDELKIELDDRPKPRKAPPKAIAPPQTAAPGHTETASPGSGAALASALGGPGAPASPAQARTAPARANVRTATDAVRRPATGPDEGHSDASSPGPQRGWIGPRPSVRPVDSPSEGASVAESREKASGAEPKAVPPRDRTSEAS